ncbi:unnamed protein product [Linum trigynum]|uniref:Uncharacterized protein n=1 Tax=Linum trigynum TaxID=586398 RepID=A0AAV2GVJ8_9ROSI
MSLIRMLSDGPEVSFNGSCHGLTLGRAALALDSVRDARQPSHKLSNSLNSQEQDTRRWENSIVVLLTKMMDELQVREMAPYIGLSSYKASMPLIMSLYYINTPIKSPPLCTL